MIALAEGSLELGEILLRQTRLTPEQLERVRALQGEKNERLADLIVEEGLLQHGDALGRLAVPVTAPKTGYLLVRVVVQRANGECTTIYTQERIYIAFFQVYSLPQGRSGQILPG